MQRVLPVDETKAQQVVRKFKAIPSKNYPKTLSLSSEVTEIDLENDPEQVQVEMNLINENSYNLYTIFLD